METVLFAFGAALLAVDLFYAAAARKKWFDRSFAVTAASAIFGAVVGVFFIFVARVFLGIEETVMAASLAGLAVGALIGGIFGLRRGRLPSSAKSMIEWQKEWLDTGWTAVWLAAVIMYFLVQAFRIPSASMRDTFIEGDHLFVNKFIYGFRVPFSGGKRVLPLRKVARGDIVVFEAPPQALSRQDRINKASKDFIKRCVAVGGDRVEISDRRLFVNGEPVAEPYLRFSESSPSPYSAAYVRRVLPSGAEYQKLWERGEFATVLAVQDNFGPVIVPEGHYFCMGDHRDRSSDSRFWGPLPDKYLKGRSLLVYWPVSRAGPR